MDRWKRVCGVFDAAADQPEHAWEEIVAREADGDSALHDQVMRILTAEREDRFRLDHPKLLIDDPIDETSDGAERIGQTIARYRVVRLVGSGGMGTVYEGVRADDAYEQRVAIKLIRSHLSAAGMASRFRRERQILAGTRPFHITARAPVEALRALKTSPPQLSSAATEDAAQSMREPSRARLRHRLAGELDNIASKAMHVEQARRYVSVEQFAADIRRYLDGLPVMAQPDSAMYRARKFMRRHPGAVTAASIAVIVLIGGSVATAAQAHRADAEARRAALERMKGARITAFLQNMLSAPDTRWAVRGVRPASQITVSDVLDDASHRAGVDLATEPAVESAVRQTLGRTYTAIGRYDQAVGQHTRALAIDRAISAPPIPDIASDVHDLAMAQFRLGHYHAADTLFRAALQVCQTHNQSADTAHVCGHSLNDLGLATMLENRLPEAEQLFRQVLMVARQLYGPSSPAVAIVLGNHAMVRESRGDLAGAERLYRQASAVYAKAGGRELPEKSYTLENLAGVLATEGRFSEAEPLFRQAMEVALRTESPYHPDVGFGWVHLGAIHRSMGKLALARIETARGLSILTAAGTGARHYSIRANTDRALLLVALGQPHEAVPILASVLDTAAAEYTADDHRVAEVQDALGQALLASRQSAKALPFFLISHATFLHNFGPTHPRTIDTEQHLKAARASG
ncbi:MAG: protein kinase family protein [Gemmatimonadaceae bacterium]